MTISEIPAAIATCAFYIMMIFLAVLSFSVVLIISVVESFLEEEEYHEHWITGLKALFTSRFFAGAIKTLILSITA